MLSALHFFLFFYHILFIFIDFYIANICASDWDDINRLLNDQVQTFETIYNLILWVPNI